MIFIGGIAEGIKQLIYGRQVFCRFCGRGTEVELYMLYTYFSFFFIPLFKWNRRFILRFRCCGRQFALNKEKGMAILKGEETEILPEDLTELQSGAWNGYQDTEAPFRQPDEAETAKRKEDRSEKRYCPHCGEEIDVSFSYCPHCGEKL